MVVEELLPGVVTPLFHAEDLAGLEGVHRDGAYEGDVHAQTAMRPCAVQTDEDSEFRRRLYSRQCNPDTGPGDTETHPLGGGSTTIATSIVPIDLGDLEQLEEPVILALDCLDFLARV